jgi:SAM-dependent methyltransferase
MADKQNILYNLLNYPVLFNTLRSILDGGQVTYLKKLLESHGVRSVLDIGCGCGFFSGITNGRYLGVDYNPHFIAYSRKKFGSARIRFEKGDVTTFRPEKRYDTSIIINSIHHFSDEETVNILKNMREATDRIVVVHDLVPLKNIISRFFYRIDRGSFIRTLEQQKMLIASAGLKIQEIHFFRRIPWIYSHATILCTE